MGLYRAFHQMISRHLANISGLLGRDQTLQHIQYLESKVKSPLQVLQRAAKCSGDVANKAPGMSSEGMAAAKVQIFLFSFMAALRESNSELLIHFFFQAKVRVPTQRARELQRGVCEPWLSSRALFPFPCGKQPIPPTSWEFP